MELDRTKLAAGLRGGDPEVIGGLIERYQHRLFRYLLALTANRAAAEDLFQETWLRVLERGYQYRPEWKFEVWLFSIARHLMIDSVRQKKGISLDELLDGFIDTGSGSGLEPQAKDPSPFDQTLAGEDSRRLSLGMTKIPAAYREVLTLRFREDLALEEVAAVIGAPLSTVKSRLYRGLEMLRRDMEEQKA